MFVVSVLKCRDIAMLQISDVEAKTSRRRMSRTRLPESLSEQNQLSTRTSLREVPSEFGTDSGVSSVVIADVFRST